MSAEPDFDALVSRYYMPLYQFAFSLTRTEAEAGDLTQQTFYIWAAKGGQLRDQAKVKSWLFTALHREFLNSRRRQIRFPHCELVEADAELPAVEAVRSEHLDAVGAVAALARLDDTFRAPIALFYLEDYSYREIAEILEIPVGTVKSRLSRGLGQLQQLMAEPAELAGRKGER